MVYSVVEVQPDYTDYTCIPEGSTPCTHCCDDLKASHFNNILSTMQPSLKFFLPVRFSGYIVSYYLDLFYLDSKTIPVFIHLIF
jgi:hypothetical protein